MDDSHSIGQENWPAVQKGMAAIVAGLDVGADQVRVSAITFDWRVNDDKGFDFLAHNTTSGAVDAVSALPGVSVKKNTVTCKAMKWAPTEGFSTARGARGDTVPQVMIVLTDGAPTDCNKKHSQLKKLSEAARDAGIHILAIGIGGTYNVKSLDIMATPPWSENVFTVASYDPSSVAKAVMRAACQ